MSIFRKYVEKSHVSVKSIKNKGHFLCRPMYVYDNTALNSS